jgi:hypothetical protein
VQPSSPKRAAQWYRGRELNRNGKCRLSPQIVTSLVRHVDGQLHSRLHSAQSWAQQSSNLLAVSELLLLLLLPHTAFDCDVGICSRLHKRIRNRGTYSNVTAQHCIVCRKEEDLYGRLQEKVWQKFCVGELRLISGAARS